MQARRGPVDDLRIFLARRNHTAFEVIQQEVSRYTLKEPVSFVFVEASDEEEYEPWMVTSIGIAKGLEEIKLLLAKHRK